MPKPRARTARKRQIALPEPELVVVMRPEAGIEATDTGLAAAAADVSPLVLRLRDAEAVMQPLFGTSERRLKHEAAAAPAAPGEGAAVGGPDLSLYYRVHAPAKNLSSLARSLSSHDAVEAAYIKPPAEPAMLNLMLPDAVSPPTVTPDFSGRQGYLAAAPGGVDAHFAWKRRGGDGRGVSIIDIEGAWQFSHEDLLGNQGGVIGGTPTTDRDWRNHGTAVVGPPLLLGIGVRFPFKDCFETACRCRIVPQGVEVRVSSGFKDEPAVDCNRTFQLI